MHDVVHVTSLDSAYEASLRTLWKEYYEALKLRKGKDKKNLHKYLKDTKWFLEIFLMRKEKINNFFIISSMRIVSKFS